MLNTEQIAESLKTLKENLTIGDPTLEEIHDAGNREILGISEEDFVLYAHMSVTYEGDPGEDYRTLNAFVLDIVTDNLESFNTALSGPVHEYLKENYGDGDLSDLEDGLDDFIWESQIDFMPLLDPSNKKLYFDIELVLVLEQ